MQKNHKPDFAVWTSSSHILSFSCLGHNESHHTNKKSNRSGDDWPGEWYKIDVAGGVN